MSEPIIALQDMSDNCTNSANIGLLKAFDMTKALFFEPDTEDFRQNYMYHAQQVIDVVAVFTSRYWPVAVAAPHIKLGVSGQRVSALFWAHSKECDMHPTLFSLVISASLRGLHILDVTPGRLHRKAVLKPSNASATAREQDTVRRVKQSASDASALARLGRAFVPCMHIRRTLTDTLECAVSRQRAASSLKETVVT